jgi:hypothetical protein
MPCPSLCAVRVAGGMESAPNDKATRHFGEQQGDGDGWHWADHSATSALARVAGELSFRLTARERPTVAKIQLVGFVGLAFGCSTPAVIPLQMSAEYGCPENSVQVTHISGDNYRGEACGHTDTFVCTEPILNNIGPDTHQQCFKVAQPDGGAK